MNIPAGRGDIDRAELELVRVDPADGSVQPPGAYALPVPQGAASVTFTRESTGDPTFGEKALGTYEVRARLRSQVSGYGDWGTLGRVTVFWLPARLTGP